MLTQFVDLHGLLVGPSVLVGGIVLFICAIGLIMRLRIMWAFSVAMLFIIGGLELYFETYQVAIPVIALAVVLIVKRDAFDKPSPLAAIMRRRHDRRREDERRLGREPMPESGIEAMSATLDDLKARSDKVEDRESRLARKAALAKEQAAAEKASVQKAGEPPASAAPADSAND